MLAIASGWVEQQQLLVYRPESDHNFADVSCTSDYPLSSVKLVLLSHRQDK